jgi:hypothetical protein
MMVLQRPDGGRLFVTNISSISYIFVVLLTSKDSEYFGFLVLCENRPLRKRNTFDDSATGGQLWKKTRGLMVMTMD